MSLIPSESASFPDLLGRGLGASKKSKWRVPHLLDQPAPAAPKAEAPAEPIAPPPVVEEKSEPIVSAGAKVAPLAPHPAPLEPLPEELPSPLSVERSAETGSSELTPIEPVSPPAPEIGSISETPVDVPVTAGPVPPGNSELADLSAILAGSVKLQMSAPPQVEEREDSPELLALEPLSHAEAPPFAATPEEIPDGPAMIPENVESELFPVVSSQKDPEVETPAAIPIRPIARSNAAAKTEASAGVEAANTEATSPLQSVIPPPRAPRAKPRLRPRPNLQPRFESDFDSSAPADDPQEEPPTPSVSAAPENPLEYLAPDISTRPEDFQSAEAAAEEWPQVRQRQRNKFFWFVGCEIIVLALLVGSVLFGWSHRFGNGSLSPAARLGAVVAAIAVAVLPIIFYGLPQSLPRDRR